MIRFCLAAMFMILLSWPAAALEGLDAGETARVIEVVDGDTVILDREIAGARQVRMTGIQAPKLPLGRKGFAEWPLAKEAKAELEALCLNKTVQLFYGGSRMDRHGRLLAHLTTTDGLWLQGEMLRRGLARVYTFPDNRERAPEMYAPEREARSAGRGIWGHPFYAVRSPAPSALGRDTGTFQVVEGRVVDAAQVRGTIYLNFGTDWRSDFTVRLAPKTARQFRREGLGPETYGGKWVRVRGWLKSRNGPMIEITHPEAIEVLEK